MLKHSLSFLAGALVITGAVFAAGGRPAHMFALGAGVLAVILAIAIYNVGLERTSRFLVALDSALHPARPARKQIHDRGAAADPIQADVVSALVHQGVSRRSAQKAVTRAAAIAGQADFEPLFRASLDALKGVA